MHSTDAKPREDHYHPSRICKTVFGTGSLIVTKIARSTVDDGQAQTTGRGRSWARTHRNSLHLLRQLTALATYGPMITGTMLQHAVWNVPI